jgi:hypothetical protein
MEGRKPTSEEDLINKSKVGKTEDISFDLEPTIEEIMAEFNPKPSTPSMRKVSPVNSLGANNGTYTPLGKRNTESSSLGAGDVAVTKTFSQKASDMFGKVKDLFKGQSTKTAPSDYETPPFIVLSKASGKKYDLTTYSDTEKIGHIERLREGEYITDKEADMYRRKIG